MKKRIITCTCGNQIATEKPKTKKIRDQPQCFECGQRVDG